MDRRCVILGFNLLISLQVDQERQSSSRGGNVNCSKCGTLVGVEDIPANGLRLFKASLAVDTQLDKDSTWESRSTESVVAAQLLELIERESIRRFVVHSNAKSGLLVWTPSVICTHPNISSSGSSTLISGIPVPADTIAAPTSEP